MRESYIGPPSPGSKRVEIRSTTSRSRLGWLCVCMMRPGTSGFWIASSDGWEQSHREMSEKGPQPSGKSRSTGTMATTATTTTKSGGEEGTQQSCGIDGSTRHVGSKQTYYLSCSAMVCAVEQRTRLNSGNLFQTVVRIVTSCLTYL